METVWSDGDYVPSGLETYQPEPCTCPACLSQGKHFSGPDCKFYREDDQL